MWVCLATFGLLTLGVLGGWSDPFDRHVLTWLSTRATPPRTRLAVALSILGSGWTVAPLCLGGFLGLRRAAPGRARWLLVTVGGGLLLFLALGFAVGRPRPAFFPSPVTEPTASFPSGHALNTTVVFLSLYLMTGSAGRAWRRGLAAFGVLTVVLVGASRLYLQIHYPTDVAAGTLLGVAWVLALHTLWTPTPRPTGLPDAGS